MDHVILNHGQVTWTTPELAPHLLSTTPHQRSLDRIQLSTDLTGIAALLGWSTLRVSGQVDRSESTVRNCWEQWTREKVPTSGKPGLERPGRPQVERIEGSCGKHLLTPQ
ncbi:hypothetical protein TNCV_2523431 [Trichonephila clavipes]|nr:hypothetical protein TNCV_2523431 [Trichonephila clavipes]